MAVPFLPHRALLNSRRFTGLRAALSNQESLKERKLGALHQALAMYQQRLGLSFQHGEADGDQLRVVFTQVRTQTLRAAAEASPTSLLPWPACAARHGSLVLRLAVPTSSWQSLRAVQARGAARLARDLAHGPVLLPPGPFCRWTRGCLRGPSSSRCGLVRTTPMLVRGWPAAGQGAN